MSTGSGTTPGNSSTTPTSNATVRVDFANRSGAQPQIPPGLLSVNRGHFDNNEATAQQIISQNGVGMVRLDAALWSIYATLTPNWTDLDTALEDIRNANLNALVTIDYTPVWLRPKVNLCPDRASGAYGAFPVDPQAWGRIAASVVHHIDSKFPGLVYGYEIWNEPDSPDFNCNLLNSSIQARMTAYYGLYAAAAPLLRAQATADGTVIRIGGPVLSTPPHVLQFLPQFVSNPDLAPYIDFVAYHHYISGTSWDGPGNNLLLATTDATQGVGATYAAVAAIVRHGLQPNAQQTPILISEYNTTADCCRISPTYSPLFNSVFLATLLNAAYTVQSVPSHINYYGANNSSEYCLLASSQDGCFYSGGALQVLPPLHTFNLLAGQDYLDMSSGGFLAAAAASNSSSLVTVGFYTEKSDSVAVINTGPSAIAVSITITNPGLSAASATLFLLNAQDPMIAAQALQLTPTSAGYTASFIAPGYSVLGISIR